MTENSDYTGHNNDNIFSLACSFHCKAVFKYILKSLNSKVE